MADRIHAAMRGEIVRLPNTRKGEVEAFAIRAKVLAEIDRGTFDYGGSFPRSKRAKTYSRYAGKHIEIREALKDYLICKTPYLSYSSLRDYEYRIYKHLIPSFGQVSLADLSARDIRDWIDKQDLSGKSINNILIPLREVFREAYQDELIGKNPLERVRALPVRSREAKPFTAQEIRLILEELGKRSVPVRAYFQFAFGSGLRTGELLSLTWGDIDLTNRRIMVQRSKVRGRFKNTKTVAGRRIVDLRNLALKAIRLIAVENSDQGEIFRNPRTGEAWRTAQTLRKSYWYPALEALGLERREPYQTRHTFASHLLSEGANPLYVAVQMGHKDWGMIRRVYGKYIQGETCTLST